MDLRGGWLAPDRMQNRPVLRSYFRLSREPFPHRIPSIPPPHTPATSRRWFSPVGAFPIRATSASSRTLRCNSETGPIEALLNHQSEHLEPFADAHFCAQSPIPEPHKPAWPCQPLITGYGRNLASRWTPTSRGTLPRAFARVTLVLKHSHPLISRFASCPDSLLTPIHIPRVEDSSAPKIHPLWKPVSLPAY